MHAVFVLRGIMDRLNRYMNDLSAQYYPYGIGSMNMGKLQLAVRPIQLVELAFPESALPDVLNTINPRFCHKPAEKVLGGVLRKILLLENADNMQAGIKPNDKIFGADVDKLFIGIKKDEKEGIELI